MGILRTFPAYPGHTNRQFTRRGAKVRGQNQRSKFDSEGRSPTINLWRKYHLTYDQTEPVSATSSPNVMHDLCRRSASVASGGFRWGSSLQ